MYDLRFSQRWSVESWWKFWRNIPHLSSGVKNMPGKKSAWSRQQAEQSTCHEFGEKEGTAKQLVKFLWVIQWDLCSKYISPISCWVTVTCFSYRPQQGHCCTWYEAFTVKYTKKVFLVNQPSKCEADVWRFIEHLYLHHQGLINAGIHTANVTKVTLATVGREIMNRNPDLAPSDFHLFGPMKERLWGLKFYTDDELKTQCPQLAMQSYKTFYAAGISNLPGRSAILAPILVL
jgi:hypothetical protein